MAKVRGSKLTHSQITMYMYSLRFRYCRGFILARSVCPSRAIQCSKLHYCTYAVSLGKNFSACGRARMIPQISPRNYACQAEIYGPVACARMIPQISPQNYDFSVVGESVCLS